MIHGNTEGLRSSLLQELETLYEAQIDRDVFAPRSLLLALAGFTARLHREISLYISRGGEVLDVTIGDSATVPLKNINLRRGEVRLCGVRCIHTHPGGDSTLSSVDIQSLRNLRFDAMAALGVKEDGQPSSLCVGLLDVPGEDGQFPVRLTPPLNAYRLPQQELMQWIEEADRRISAAAPPAQRRRERAVVAGLADGPEDPSLLELKRLAETAGAQVVGVAYQNKVRMDPATYLGSGKAEELNLLCQSLDADLLLLDDELTGAQVRNLEDKIACRIVDRTALILDIFAMRAQSREGKLQVELAQLRYRLPRLTGLGVALSRLGGGIGTRGPGETKLEEDRRRIRRRIADIERELAELTRQRGMRRERRSRKELPVVALVGYTNAGKSSLLNALTGAGVLAEDKLFATLDPITRHLRLPGGLECLLVDTVGFINKLPHDLVRAFRSTLEEAMYADALVIVEDVSDENLDLHRQVVDEVLSSLGAGDKPRVTALNKADLLPEDVRPGREGFVAISATQGLGLTALLEAVEQKLTQLRAPREIHVPYARGDVAAFLHKNGYVQEELYDETGTLFHVSLDSAAFERAKHMLASR